jgi:hypothetical protein
MRSLRRVAWLLLVTLLSLVLILVNGGATSRPESTALQRSSSSDAQQAVATATLALNMFQSSGDAQFLAAAEAALAAWSDTPQPPRAVWMLRARLLQAHHQFAAAAQDIATFNRVHGDTAETLLLEADTWRRAGMIATARRACLRLALLGRDDLARFCAADVLLSLGEAEAALALLTSVIVAAGDNPSPEREWGMAIYADALSANGELAQAATVWESIAPFPTAPLSYRLAYADVLLSQSHYEAVKTLLGDHTQSAAALLRLAVAASRLGDEGAVMWQAMLQDRLAQADHHAGSGAHLREQALIALWLEGNAEKSLQLAERNWEQQKGWEDAHLVLMIAPLLGREDAMRRVRGWQIVQAADGNL